MASSQRERIKCMDRLRQGGICLRDAPRIIVCRTSRVPE